MPVVSEFFNRSSIVLQTYRIGKTHGFSALYKSRTSGTCWCWKDHYLQKRYVPIPVPFLIFFHYVLIMGSNTGPSVMLFLKKKKSLLDRLNWSENLRLLAIPASAAAAGILLNACYPYTDCLPSLKLHIYSRLVTPVDSVGDPWHFVAYPDPYLWLMDLKPDTTPFFIDFKDAKQINFFHIFSHNLPTGTSASV